MVRPLFGEHVQPYLTVSERGTGRDRQLLGSVPGHSGIIATDVVVVAVSGERTLASGSDPGSCLALAQSGM